VGNQAQQSLPITVGGAVSLQGMIGNFSSDSDEDDFGRLGVPVPWAHTPLQQTNVPGDVFASPPMHRSPPVDPTNVFAGQHMHRSPPVDPANVFAGQHMPRSQPMQQNPTNVFAGPHMPRSQAMQQTYAFAGPPMVREQADIWPTSDYYRPIAWGTAHPDYQAVTMEGKEIQRASWSDPEVGWIRHWLQINCTEYTKHKTTKCLEDIKKDPAAVAIFHAIHTLNPERLAQGFRLANKH
jgi:hypothetical protein